LFGKKENKDKMTISLHPVGAARILNPLRIMDKGTPTNAAPPPNRIPFFIQFIAWVPSDVKDPSALRILN
jgi:hypothetical protein